MTWIQIQGGGGSIIKLFWRAQPIRVNFVGILVAHTFSIKFSKTTSECLRWNFEDRGCYVNALLKHIVNTPILRRQQ